MHCHMLGPPCLSLHIFTYVKYKWVCYLSPGFLLVSVPAKGMADERLSRQEIGRYLFEALTCPRPRPACLEQQGIANVPDEVIAVVIREMVEHSVSYANSCALLGTLLLAKIRGLDNPPSQTLCSSGADAGKYALCVVITLSGR